MDFFIPLPFPNFGNGFFQFPSRSRILKSHSRSPLSESDKEKILEVVEEKLTWLRENGDDAAAEELKTQKKELEEVSQPIIAGVYKQEGDKSTAEEHHSDDEL